MNEKIREFERQSGLEIYGLGKDRTKWKAAVKKYTELVVKECIDALDEADGSVHHSECLLEHFGVEE
jgi:hypothetical protein